MPRSRRRQRDVLTSTPSLTSLLGVTPSSLSPFHQLSPLTEFEDRRTYHPEGPYRPTVSFSGPDAQVVVRDRKGVDRFAGLRKFPSQTKGFLAFDEPDRVLVCVRRQQRKEVLHAKKRTGRGGGRRRKPRRNWQSQISCR